MTTEPIDVDAIRNHMWTFKEDQRLAEALCDEVERLRDAILQAYDGVPGKLYSLFPANSIRWPRSLAKDERTMTEPIDVAVVQDILNRTRSQWYERPMRGMEGQLCHALQQALDEVERLRAENETLKKALRNIRDTVEWRDDRTD